MLTIAGSFHVDGCTVFRDVVRRHDRWDVTSIFYAVPDRPRLALEADGAPAFDFLQYRRAADAPDASGGVVSLTVELAVADDRPALVRAITAALGAAAPAEVTFGVLPVTGGTVTLAFAGETGDTGAGDFARKIGGTGPARLAGRERATFIVDLSADGAALLRGALDAGRDVLHARYAFDVAHVLGDIELRVWCDARGAHRIASSRSAAGSLSPAGLRDALVGEHLAGYELVSEQPMDAEHRRQLDALGATMLEQVLSEAFLDDRGGTVPWQDQLPSLVNRSYRESAPLVSSVVVEDVLAIAGTLPPNRVRQIDLDGGRSSILDVTVHCTLGDEDDLVDTVKATLRYTRLNVEQRSELVFNRRNTTARVRADLAGPSERTYGLDALVYYSGETEPTRLTFPPSQSSIAVLDLDGLGVLRVDVALGDVPFDRVRHVTVDLAHEPQGRAHTFILDRDQPSGTWRTVIREHPRRWKHRAAWTLDDDMRIDGAWEESEGARLVLHAPDAARRIAQVQVVSAEPFDGVAQIAVRLRASADDVSPEDLVFTAAGQRKEWTVPRLTGQAIAYDVRETVVYTDGHVADREWRREDAPVLIVRDRGRFVVRILTRLLQLGPERPLALLALEPLDGSNAPLDRATLPLRDAADARWSFRVDAPDRHRYRHQLTLISRSGQRTSLPWQEAADEVLVLTPPA